MGGPRRRRRSKAGSANWTPISRRAPTSTARPRPSAISLKCSPGESSSSWKAFRESCRRNAGGLPDRQRRSREAQRARAPQPRRFPEDRAGAHRHPRRLRARRVRCVHGARRRRNRPRLPDVRGASGRLHRGHHRRLVRLARDRGAEKRVRPHQRAAVRLLHARRLEGGAGAVARRAQSLARAHPGISLRQLLPLHRLPGDRRCDRSRGQGPRRQERSMSEFDETAKTLLFDAPNSYVGRSVTRPNARRLTQGRGQYVDDIVLPRMVHVAYVRSPHAHPKIVKIESKKAAAMPGVVRIATGAEIALVCKPYVGVLTHLAGMRSPPQYPLAIEAARWQGEPLVAVVAQSRAEAADAVDPG